MGFRKASLAISRSASFTIHAFLCVIKRSREENCRRALLQKAIHAGGPLQSVDLLHFQSGSSVLRQTPGGSLLLLFFSISALSKRERKQRRRNREGVQLTRRFSQVGKSKREKRKNQLFSATSKSEKDERDEDRNLDIGTTLPLT